MGYIGKSMSENAANACAKGRKPISRITKDDILKFGIKESITFFRWYLKNYCDTNEWHHTSPKYNITYYYDIKDCCAKLKNADIEKLKTEYKEQTKPKIDKNIDSKPYYAKVKYSISTYTGKRKYFEVYVIIYKNWAYFDDDYHKKISKKKIDGKHFCITEKYPNRPKEMSKKIADTILENISSN